ncbi:hypothetical protein [Sphingomonas sp. BK069]|uniref:hypothetical protein n=1 Tax=Sphingomonas sp. BK069 TaxID=2586979 RepID=UPI001615FA82|nr:hypothetical protein [Sphingomonas sp. BK069]MBB3348308.1 hypothetical protein [Sphingomonas sp. BK069]
MKKVVLLSLLLLTPEAATASSTAAWARLGADVRQRCSAETRLRGATTSDPVVFSDLSGKVAMLVAGVLSRKGGRPVRVSYLCLYDRRTGRAEVQEAGDWRAAR